MFRTYLTHQREEQGGTYLTHQKEERGRV